MLKKYFPVSSVCTYVIIVISYFSLNTANAQNVAQSTKKILNWAVKSDSKTPLLKNFSLSNAKFGTQVLPSVGFTLETKNKSRVEFSGFEYQEMTGYTAYLQAFSDLLGPEFKTKVYYTMGGNTGYTGISICPFKKEGGRIYQLTAFDYQLADGEAFSTVQNQSKKRATTTSVLNTGEWFKFSVTQDGMYKIDAKWLSDAGISLNGIDPRTIKIYSTQGGMLPEKVSDFRYDDLPENAIKVEGENDGSFDASDYIVFYAQSPNKWKYDTALKRYKHIMNIYSDKTYFFMTFGGAGGKRINAKNNGQNLTANKTFDWFNYQYFHDEEKENVCHEGRIVLGEKFDATTSYSFDHTISNIDGGQTGSIHFFAVVSTPPLISNKVTMTVNNIFADELVFYELPSDEPPCYSVAKKITGYYPLTTSNPSLKIGFNYQKPVSSTKAWLDYYEILCARKLIFNESFMPFRNYESITASVSEYRLSSLPSGALIYNVTNPTDVKIQNVFDDNGTSVFRDTVSYTGLANEFVLHDGTFLSPKSEGRVGNQNLHGTGNVQFIIVSAPAFLEAANKLADFHKNEMTVKVVTPQSIYNEFSGGAQDISAIRDYFRLVYINNTNPATQLKYAMFMGDASYDYKDKIANNNNFVPTFESDPNLKEGYSYYCTDDFFGYLDTGDGNSRELEKLEITVSRLPAASAEEAMGMVNKIYKYKESVTLGDWRNAATFLADDIDESWESMFVEDFEDIFKNLDANFKNVNVRKVYLDAYKQENLGGSQRYPEVQDAIIKEFEKGTLVFCYMGHGGDEYIASEKVIDIPLVNRMQNIHNLPAFFTASCSIGKFDDATHKSGGEYLITNPNGGSIAMFTTVRLVGAGDNAILTKYFWNECIYAMNGGKWPTLGEVYKKLKNRLDQSPNDINFTLFADPALVLNYPENIVKIDSINSRSTATGNDTLKALAKVTFKGHIEDISGNTLSGFNGILSPTIYDKKSKLLTMGNNNANQKLPFELYNNILYKGEASITNGKYAFTFVVPKDIAYNYGYGKVSLYGKNEQTDAWGHTDNMLVGGTSSNVLADNTGPEIELFVDDYSFISGGLTDNTPLLLARIKDENGVNTSGSGIGRDLLITIDKGTINEKSYVANSFYKANLNSYTSGEIKYQLDGVADGKHTYTLKVWDVYNNSSEVTIEFNVSNGEAFQIKHLLNYPNPFSTNTTFHFDHNRAGQNLNVIITVYNINGKVVKTIEQYIPSSNGHVADISWNGRDDYDDKMAKGVYIYNIRIRTDDGQSNQMTEKLVILN